MKFKLFTSFFLSFLIFGNIGLKAQSFEPKWVGSASALTIDGDTVALPLEKANVQVKTSSSAGVILLGIGNTRKKCVIKGGRSTVQLSPDKPIQIIVRCKENDQDPSTFIQVIKFEEKKKERKAELANVNWLGNVTEGDMNIIPYDADAYGKSSYLLTIPAQEGEFGIRILNPNEVDEKVPLFQCFVVHY